MKDQHEDRWIQQRNLWENLEFHGKLWTKIIRMLAGMNLITVYASEMKCPRVTGWRRRYTVGNQRASDEEKTSHCQCVRFGKIKTNKGRKNFTWSWSSKSRKSCVTDGVKKMAIISNQSRLGNRRRNTDKVHFLLRWTVYGHPAWNGNCWPWLNQVIRKFRLLGFSKGVGAEAHRDETW